MLTGLDKFPKFSLRKSKELLNSEELLNFANIAQNNVVIVTRIVYKILR